MEIEEREKKIYRVTLMGSVVNVVLLVFKFVAGAFIVRFPHRHCGDSLRAHQFKTN